MQNYRSWPMKNGWCIRDVYKRQAYESICEKKPDIVITDIRMPVYDGLELIRRAKEAVSYTHLQVMLLQDTIGEHLLEVDKAAREREEVILKQLEEKEPLPDKEKDQMAWVRAANQHRAIAEEIILKELIYV